MPESTEGVADGQTILTASFVIACKVLGALKIDIEDFYNDYAGNDAK